MNAPRVGIVGARRVRQGLGPFVVRHLHEAGARVACFLATSPESRDAAARALRETAGIEARGYLDVERMLADEDLDALAILSPAGTHLHYLQAAAAADLYVLCEKPLVWQEGDLGAIVGDVLREYERRGLLLVENCQWPYTLGAYEELFPGKVGSATQFAMRLSPRAIGPNVVADALPHPVSLLQAIAPGDAARVDAVRCTRIASAGEGIRIAFRYANGGREIETRVDLAPGPEQPREAGYALDGCWAHRLLRTRDYAIFFSDGVRVVDVPDPVRALVHDFVRALQSASSGERQAVAARRGPEMARRAEMLHCLRTALAGQFS